MHHSRAKGFYKPVSRAGNLYYVRLSTDLGFLYKIGYTNLESVHSRLAFAGEGSEGLIDKVLLFHYLEDAYDVEQRLHSYFVGKSAFGRYSSCEDMPLYKNGQSELYCDDVLRLDPDFSDAQANKVRYGIRLKVARRDKSEKDARRYLKIQDVGKVISRCVALVVFYFLVFPIYWILDKVGLSRRAQYAPSSESIKMEELINKLTDVGCSDHDEGFSEETRELRRRAKALLDARFKNNNAAKRVEIKEE